MPVLSTLDDPLLTPHQTGTQIGVSVNTLTNWRNLHGQERLPFIKINSRDVRYRRSAVLAFIAAREAATSEVILAAAARRIGKAGQSETPRPGLRARAAAAARAETAAATPASRVATPTATPESVCTKPGDLAAATIQAQLLRERKAT
jgi:hypothetical protein